MSDSYNRALYKAQESIRNHKTKLKSCAITDLVFLFVAVVMFIVFVTRSPLPPLILWLIPSLAHVFLIPLLFAVVRMPYVMPLHFSIVAAWIQLVLDVVQMLVRLILSFGPCETCFEQRFIASTLGPLFLVILYVILDIIIVDRIRKIVAAIKEYEYLSMMSDNPDLLHNRYEVNEDAYYGIPRPVTGAPSTSVSGNYEIYGPPTPYPSASVQISIPNLPSPGSVSPYSPTPVPQQQPMPSAPPATMVGGVYYGIGARHKEPPGPNNNNNNNIYHGQSPASINNQHQQSQVEHSYKSQAKRDAVRSRAPNSSSQPPQQHQQQQQQQPQQQQQNMGGSSLSYMVKRPM